jgi:error-prone DNA polymerase
VEDAQPCQRRGLDQDKPDRARSEARAPGATDPKAPTALSANLAGVGERDGGFPLQHGRGNELHYGSQGLDPRSLPPKGLRTRDIYIPELHIDSIKVKTRDFR